MKIELNDETLTAYALGELDAAETKAVEKQLADAARAGNDAPRIALEEIRGAIEAAEAAFAGSAPDVALTAEQRTVLETTAATPHRFTLKRKYVISVLATAAVFTIIAMIPSRIVPDLMDAKDKFNVTSNDTPVATPGVAQPNEIEHVPFFLDKNSRNAPSQTPAAVPQEVQEQSNAIGYGRAKEPSVDPLRYESVPDKNTGGTPLADSAQTSQTGTPETVNTQPVENPNEATAVERVVLPDSGLTSAPEPKKEAEQSNTPVWKRRPRPDPATAEKDERSNRRFAREAKQDVVLSPDTAGAAVAAPAAPPVSLPEIASDPLFSPAPQVGAQSNSSNHAWNRGATVSGGISGNIVNRANFGLQEQEQLRSLGYANASSVQSDSATIASRFQTAAIDDRTGWRYRQPGEPAGTEAYAPIAESPFIRVGEQPLSTFSIDVDTASYSNMRRYLDQGQLPPADAVRVEELINYFDYAYPAPTDGRPFAAHFEAAACPWMPAHTLVRIGLKGREVPRAERPATNLVFLIDVSGSMQPENKLPLVKRAMAMLTRQLDERDRVTIVTYASGVNLALPVTNASQQDRILGAIENLGAGGSTNGAGGIQLAYESARRNFLQGGVNRVILATDGDFNVGISDNNSLLALIQQEAKSGVFLSVFGFGMGNLKDDKLEMLADKGNGVYGYIDSESEARKVFVEKLSGTLVTIAKDVKIQVEFNPARVAAYRLIGYENRALAAQDFNDDRKDAGEIGAGHTVTALYEVVPTGQAIPAAGTVDALRYQNPQAAMQNEAARAIAPAGTPAHADELLLVKLRYKEPEGAASKLLEFPLKDQRVETPSADLKFASAVAAFGKMLRGNPAGPMLTYDGMMQLAQAGLAASDDPRRAEMIHLMLQARPLIEAQPNDRRYLESIGYVQ